MMDTNESQTSDDKGVDVDQQDGGPGSHTEDNSGGQHDDVASGGGTETTEDTTPDSVEHDVHGEPDTVS